MYQRPQVKAVNTILKDYCINRESICKCFLSTDKVFGTETVLYIKNLNYLDIIQYILSKENIIMLSREIPNRNNYYSLYFDKNSRPRYKKTQNCLWDEYFCEIGKCYRNHISNILDTDNLIPGYFFMEEKHALDIYIPKNFAKCGFIEKTVDILALNGYATNVTDTVFDNNTYVVIRVFNFYIRRRTKDDKRRTHQRITTS